MAIDSFKGEHEFLSNFYLVDIPIEGYGYPTVEHAFQALKTLDPVERFEVASKATPGQAKRAGQLVTLRPDWEQVKLKVMEGLIALKFSPHHHPDLSEKLYQTGSEELIEGNNWGDRFWGVDGVGENHLGKLLMKRRDWLRLWVDLVGHV